MRPRGLIEIEHRCSSLYQARGRGSASLDRRSEGGWASSEEYLEGWKGERIWNLHPGGLAAEATALRGRSDAFRGAVLLVFGAW